MIIKILSIYISSKKLYKKNKKEQIALEPEGPTVLPEKKILILSDLHYFTSEEYEKLKTIEYDFCLLLGDIGSELQVLKKVIPIDKIYGITGNHDSKNLLLLSGVNDINGVLVNVEGINIVGLSGSFKYKCSDDLSMISQEESIDICNKLPKADILISHECAYELIRNDTAHQGLKGITNYLDTYKPPLHLFGHYHLNLFIKYKDTNCFCMYRCNILNTRTLEVKNIF